MPVQPQPPLRCGPLEVAFQADVVGARLAQTRVVLSSRLSPPSLAEDRSLGQTVEGLSDRVENVCHHLEREIEINAVKINRILKISFISCRVRLRAHKSCARQSVA